MFLSKLLQTSMTNFYEYFCLHSVGLTMDRKLFFRYLNGKTTSTWSTK